MELCEFEHGHLTHGTSRGLNRVRGVFAYMLVALALVAPSTAGASLPADRPRMTELVGIEGADLATARANVAELERELERELRASASRAASPDTTCEGETSVLPEAARFYERLMREPLQVALNEAQPTASPVGPAAPSEAAGRPLLDLALAYRGVPYRWGGADRDGLDCSGLIVRAVADAGHRAPHSAASLYRLGEPVAADDLRPGDLVFFRDTYKPGISHVGLHLEGSRFVHASSAAGKVTVGDLNRPYYRQKYAGARRLCLGADALSATGRWLASAGTVVGAPFGLGPPRSSS